MYENDLAREGERGGGDITGAPPTTTSTTTVVTNEYYSTTTTGVEVGVGQEALEPPQQQTPEQQLQELQAQAEQLQAKHASLQSQLAEAVSAAVTELPPPTHSPLATSTPLPTTPSGLVEELSLLHATRKYLQYLQELQNLTKQAEKQVRSAERSFTDGVDLAVAVQECSTAVDAFSHAIGYAIALEQLKLEAPSVEQLGAPAIGRLHSSGTNLRSLLHSAAQQALGRCGWPPQALFTSSSSSSSSAAAAAASSTDVSNNGHDWIGFGGGTGGTDAVGVLQHIFVVQITLQRSMEHEAFAALSSSLPTATATAEGDGPLLWPSIELVEGISGWLHHHFASGLPTDRIDKPEWLFTAALKAARLCAAAAAELQPCIDAHSLQQWYCMQFEVARAIGMAAVAPILRAHVLPRLAAAGDSAVWLHFVDEAVAFERALAPLRGVLTASLIANGGIQQEESVDDGLGDGIAHPGSILEVVFEEQQGAEAWLAAERGDAERQMDAAVDAPDAWKPAMESNAAVLDLSALGLGAGVGVTGGVAGGAGAAPPSLASQHEFYPPICAESVIALLGTLAKRQAYIYKPEHKAMFTAEVIAPTLHAFRTRMDLLMTRVSQFDNLLDTTELPKVGAAICAAHYLEHSLREPTGGLLTVAASDPSLGASLDREADTLAHSRRSWSLTLAKLASDRFQAACEGYTQDLSSFALSTLPTPIPTASPSPTLLPAAHGLHALLQSLSSYLDAVVFRDVWKGLALAVNTVLFNDVATEAMFSVPRGAMQFGVDVDALVGVFGFCTSRPSAHFKETREACALLCLGAEEAAGLAAMLHRGGGGGAEALRAAGIKALNAEQAFTVLGRRLDLSQHGLA